MYVIHRQRDEHKFSDVLVCVTLLDDIGDTFNEKGQITTLL